ncbi:inverse autotransporter beta domain-containing protein (plasmid) [Salmonella enterica subsp. salamae]|nr:inverse autotransporter beta domain-containing protein [Salmonella enterica]QVP66139.1 inverse autotransporter beta domain-containing protein [Salmonella enterica subsp. salamae]
MNWRIGEPLSHQLDTDAVTELRSLAGSRYDLNDIILEYRKQEVVKLYLPACIEDRAGKRTPSIPDIWARWRMTRRTTPRSGDAGGGHRPDRGCGYLLADRGGGCRQIQYRCHRDAGGQRR